MLLVCEPSSVWWRTPSEELRQYRREYNARPEVHAKKLARQKAYYWRHRERRLGLQRTVNYGCTPDEYLAMFVGQQGKCAICRRDLPERNAVLDRIEAMRGYTRDNTRLLCRECDDRQQEERGFA